MNFAPLLNASLAIQIHFLTVVPAFFIGTWLIFFSTKGAPFHRLLGKAYMVLMATTAIAAIFIKSFVGPSIEVAGLELGLIHLFVVVTFVGIFNAIRGLQLGNIKRHQHAMIGTYIGGLLIAGGFAFMPGRIMHSIFFG